MTRPNITKIYVRKYRDNGQTKAYVEWSNGGRTEGSPKNTHVVALFARAEREGLTVTREIW